jgi:bifunctional non-homologous end joining protein LigD
MGLELYRKKRNFKTTPEPAGRVVKRRKKALAFVIQKHAASHLHYDFRLELNGVLLSWAVPKGPSLDPNDKRLAMHVEDHPIEYGDFEGVIPPKQYGSGTVLLWDRGTWIPKEDPEAGYRKGRLKFTLNGEKLHGGWTLVKTHGGKYGNGSKEAWLLIKEGDEFASPSPVSVVQEHPNSVTSGRSLEEIAADEDRVWHSNKSVAENVKSGAVRKQRLRASLAQKVRGAVKASLPEFVKPVLATLVDAPPTGDEWLHEMKYDGYRILARVENGKARLYSRNGKEWTANFPTIARAAGRLPLKSAWLDGEVVVMQADGRSSFQALQNALSGGDASDLRYYLFDLPYLDGFDLLEAPLVERKRVLQTLLASKQGPLRMSTHVQGSGAEFFEQACRLKLEGVICKRADSTYQAGRGRSWVKVKCEMRQEVVIGGYTDPEGSRAAFGALLLGVYEGAGRLRYCGKVGTGFNGATLKLVKEKLDPLLQKEPPFVNPPKGAEARRAHWVKPELVAEVRFTEWTNDGTLRHPSFQGLREDKKASDVVRERAVSTASAEPESKPTAKRAARQATESGASHTRGDAIAGIRLSHADKLLYPEANITKRDLAEYYQTVCEWILPQLKDRPLTLVRCPNGWNKQCFYQKNADESVSAAIERVTVQTSEGPGRYMMVNSLSALVALVQMGVLEIHPWGSTRHKLGCPDRIIFDFDPDDGLDWSRVVEAVHLMKTLLEQIGLHGFLKTTGGKGLHVVVPIRPTLPWDEIKTFSKAVAELLCRTFPDRFTDKVTKSRRSGKIYIDYLRNAEGSTAIAPYALRARENAPVATPIGWNELGKEVRFDHFNVRNVPARLKRLKTDPWDGFFEMRQTVTKAVMKKVGYSDK